MALPGVRYLCTCYLNVCVGCGLVVAPAWWAGDGGKEGIGHRPPAGGPL